MEKAPMSLLAPELAQIPPHAQTFGQRLSALARTAYLAITGQTLTDHQLGFGGGGWD